MQQQLLNDTAQQIIAGIVLFKWGMYIGKKLEYDPDHPWPFILILSCGMMIGGLRGVLVHANDLAKYQLAPRLVVVEKMGEILKKIK